MEHARTDLSEFEVRCLEAFPNWLDRLGGDALELLRCATSEGVSTELQLPLLGALNYLFKSLDLIPDGIEDLGYLDDAFVLRVVVQTAPLGSAPDAVLTRLKGEAELIAELLGEDFDRLTRYVSTLGTVVARGRTTQSLVEDSDALCEFTDELRDWADSYVAPGFARDDKNLVKLRSFLRTKLPA